MKFKLTILVLSLVALFLLAASPEFQAATRFRAIHVRGNATVVGDIDVDGTSNLDVVDIDGAVDFGGQELDVDADNDTSITADTDDQIDVEISGADEFVFTADQLDVTNGQIVNIGAAGTDFSATGGLTLADALTVSSGAVTIARDQEHVGVMSVITTTVPYTPASGTVATVGDGEIWLVHKVFVRTDTNFDCTGDDCTLTIGDGNDADGFITAADASIQAAFTEATGFAAGYYGIESGSAGAYTTDNGGPFVYAPSGADETIDYAVGGTSPAAGSATAFVLYTRIQ